MERGQVDLRNCEPGDILISALGKTLRYLRPTKEGEYLDHLVEYLDENGNSDPLLGNGTRTHDGYTYAKKRIPETDHDIVKIIKKNEYDNN